MRQLLAIAAIVCVSGCAYRSPEPGQVAVLVDYPWIFGHGGVRKEPLTNGSKLVWSSTNAVYVNMKPRTLVIHFDDMMTRDGVPLDFDAGFTFRITDPVCMVEKFGMGDYEATKGNYWPVWFFDNLYKPLETGVRSAVKRHGLNETAIQASAVEEIDAEVTAAIDATIKQTGLCVVRQEFTVGRANPPDSVKDQRIATAAQQQRIETEKQGKLAEDQRKAREESRAAADNAYRNALSLSPEQFLRLETIQMQRDVCTKGGCTFIAGDVVPVLNSR